MDGPEGDLLNRWIFVLVRVGDDYIVPYTDDARRLIMQQGGYGVEFEEFLQRFLESLSAPTFAAGSYYPGGFYRSLTAEPQVAPLPEITAESMGPFYLEEMRVEADGRWRVGENEIKGRVLAHFLSNLEFDKVLERYRIRYRLEEYFDIRYIHPLSPPYRVVSVNVQTMTAVLNDGTTATVRPDSLRMDSKEHLTMAVKADGLPALCEDNARWQILQHAESRNGNWTLTLPTGEVPLNLDGPRPYLGDIAPDRDAT